MAVRILTVLLLTLGLSACDAINATNPDADGRERTLNEPVEGAVALDVQNVSVIVPRTLSISEKNAYFPRADIVWREDPYGDRYEQVDAIITAAAERAATENNSGLPVNAEFTVTRFHAQSEKVRASNISSTHDVHFTLRLKDPKTGADILLKPVSVEVEIAAYHGNKAIEAMQRGETQKVRIIQFVSEEMDALFKEAINVNDAR